jgi:hypothetical protein
MRCGCKKIPFGVEGVFVGDAIAPVIATAKALRTFLIPKTLLAIAIKIPTWVGIASLGAIAPSLIH